MPSGLQRILPRMRVSGDALRIALLVATGVTAGYFWRAAFETERSAAPPVASSANLAGETLNPRPTVRSTVRTAHPRSGPARHVVRRAHLVARSRVRFVMPQRSSPPVPRQEPTAGRPAPSSPPPRPSHPSAPPPGSIPPGGSASASTPPPAPPAPGASAPGPGALAAPPPPTGAKPPAQPARSKKEQADEGEGEGNEDRDRPGWGRGD